MAHRRQQRSSEVICLGENPRLRSFGSELPTLNHTGGLGCDRCQRTTVPAFEGLAA